MTYPLGQAIHTSAPSLGQQWHPLSPSRLSHVVTLVGVHCVFSLLHFPESVLSPYTDFSSQSHPELDSLCGVTMTASVGLWADRGG